MKVINYRNITYSEVNKLLSELLEKGLELDQLAMRVKEYVSKFNKCPNAEEVAKELKDKGLLEISAVMIANIRPQNKDELKALLNFEPETPSDEVMEEILNILEKKCV